MMEIETTKGPTFQDDSKAYCTLKEKYVSTTDAQWENLSMPKLHAVQTSDMPSHAMPALAHAPQHATTRLYAFSSYTPMTLSTMASYSGVVPPTPLSRHYRNFGTP